MSFFNTINIFNFLRGTGALSILIYHVCYLCYINTPHIPAPWILFMPAWVAVWTFFLLSGYLLGKGFVAEKYKTDSLKDFWNFYLQRAIRILSVYYFIVLIDIIFVNTGAYLDIKNHVLTEALFLSIKNHPTAMNGNMWFICPMVRLYLILPFVHLLLVKSINKIKYKKIIFAGIILLLVFTEFFLRLKLLGHAPWGEFTYSMWYFNLDFFIGGFLLNYIFTNRADNKLKSVLRPCLMILYGIFFVVHCYLMSKHWMLDVGAEDLKIYSPLITFFMVALLIYAFDVKKETAIAPNIKMKLFNPLCWIEYAGIISMGLFVSHCQTISQILKAVNFVNPTIITFNIFNLLHKPIIIKFSAHCKTFWVVLILSILFSCIWGVLINKLIEQPINNYRKSINKIS